MKRVERSRSFIALVAAVLLIATSGSAALATTTRYTIESHATAAAVEVPDSGTMTQHGNVISVRGRVSTQTQVSSSLYGGLVAGTETNVFNYDLDLVKETGFWWGKGTHVPVLYPDGTWECSWHGTLANNAWTGQGVCRGTGTLKGWQWRADLSMDQYNILHTQGYIFFPGDCSPVSPATGRTASAIGIGSTRVVVALDPGSCSFAGAGMVTFKTYTESVTLIAAVPVLPGLEELTISSTTTNHPANEPVEGTAPCP